MSDQTDHKKRAESKQEDSPTLVPPDASVKEEPQSTRAPFLIAGIGLLLVILALGVLFLPLSKIEPKTSSTVPAETTPQGIAPQVSVRQEALTQSAEAAAEVNRLVETWLHKQAAAEAENIATWGGAAYTDANSDAQECGRLLTEQEYLAAQLSCKAAITQLDELMAGKESLFEEAVHAGFLAIEQGDPETAATKFEQALTIDMDDQRALDGARRSANLPQVLRFIEEGQALQTSGDLDGALLAFREASSLDPDFSAALDALASVERLIAEREFQQAMSHALQAYAEGKLQTAAKALRQAQSIRPNDPAAQDLKVQITRQQLARKLETLRQSTENLERQERWQEALTTCEQALGLDAQAAFAVGCKERINRRIALDNQLKNLLAKPERLFEDGPLAEARLLLAQASGLSPRGPILSGQTEQLAKLVSEAETEVEVILRSDQLTEVAIYHVGRLGQFQEKKLVLRSGNYIATGRRKGFKDIRQTLKVRPGASQMIFTLRCEEPI